MKVIMKVKNVNSVNNYIKLHFQMEEYKMRGVYTGLYLAKYIISKCTNDGHPISNLQLQKILFKIQKYYLKHNQRLIIDEFEAWTYGPVLRDVYFEYCSYGSMPINEIFSIKNPDNKIKRIIDPIIAAQRKKEPWELVGETHRQGGAWDIVYKNGIGNKEVIPIELIKEKG